MNILGHKRYCLHPPLRFFTSDDHACEMWQSVSRQIRIGRLTIEIWQTFESFCWGQLKNTPPWDLSCIANRPVLEGISGNADLPFWNACREGMNLLRFFKFTTGWFPQSFFPARKRLLRNWPCVGITFLIAPFSNISKTSFPLVKIVLLTFLASLVFSPGMGDLQTGFCTPLQ